jgi:hypothetical protein
MNGIFTIPYKGSEFFAAWNIQDNFSNRFYGTVILQLLGFAALKSIWSLILHKRYK